MKAFFAYFFGAGTQQEFSIFTFAHFAPILVMLGVILLIYRNREAIRNWKHEETLRYILAFALIICDMSYYWRLAGGAPWLLPGPVENLPIGVCGWSVIFCSYTLQGPLLLGTLQVCFLTSLNSE